MDTNRTLPQPVIDLLAAAFPGAPLTRIAPTVGGFSNLTLAAQIGAERCIIKAASLPAKRADLRREALVLGLLRGRRLAAPTPLAFREDEDWAVLVTRRRPGRPGLTLYAGPPEGLAPACGALGRALARLHATPPPADTSLALGPMAAGLAAALAELPLAEALRAPLSAALAHPAWHSPRPRLVHGDAGLHNVLWGRRGLSLLDWELAGLGDPRIDLAWVAWTMRFRNLPPTHWEQLLSGYGHERAGALGLDAATLRALALGQVARLLVRAAGRPEAWEEWQRRAQITLQLNQIEPG